MTGHDAKTILVHGDITVLVGDNETTGKAKSPQCESLNQAPATILFLMTKCTMSTVLFLMTESTMATCPKFQVGQVWRTRNGEICRIIFIDQDKTCKYPICTDLRGGHWHHLDGKSYVNDGDNLVSLTGKPVPESPPTTSIPAASATNAIPAPMVNGDVPFYVVVAIDPDGEKLVWETPMPEGATLEAALKQRLRLNPRYSVSYIAECRIILIPAQQS